MCHFNDVNDRIKIKLMRTTRPIPTISLWCDFLRKFLSTSFSFLMYISYAMCVECWKVKYISSLDEIDIDSRLIPWRQCRISPYKDVVS